MHLHPHPTFLVGLQKFEPFIEPICANLEKLAGVVTVKSDEVRRMVIGMSRDLRGILQAAHNKPTYVQVFDAIFPRHVETLVAAVEVCVCVCAWLCVREAYNQCQQRSDVLNIVYSRMHNEDGLSRVSCLCLVSRVQTFWDDPQVTTSLLKFMTEFVYTRGQRISFGSASANGILLFREASNMIVNYGKHIADVTPSSEEYANKFKGITIVLSMLVKALDGGYVNFGVFAMYGDPALDNALGTALKLTLPLGTDTIMVRALALFVPVCVWVWVCHSVSECISRRGCEGRLGADMLGCKSVTALLYARYCGCPQPLTPFSTLLRR